MKKKVIDNLQRWRMTNSVEKLKIHIFYFIFFPRVYCTGVSQSVHGETSIKTFQQFEYYFKCTFYIASMTFFKCTFKFEKSLGMHYT